MKDLYSLREGDIAFLTKGEVSHHTLIVTGYKNRVWWNPLASYGTLINYHNGGIESNSQANIPKQNILLTKVIARSRDDILALAKVGS